MILGYVVPLAMTAHKSLPLCNKGLKKAENTSILDIISSKINEQLRIA